MLVSVIVAVRNGERYLRSALDSVFGQDYRSFEVIVVDGQSTDATAAIARSYPGVCYVWQTGKGVSDAYNVGIAAAAGELVAFISHDDLWAPHKLGRQVLFMQEHPTVQLTVTKAHYFVDEGQSAPRGFRQELLQSDPVGFCMETLMVRKALFDRIGGFDPGFVVAEDVDWFARAIDSRIEMAVVPEVLLYKRVHAESTVNTHLHEQNHLLLRAMRSSIARKHDRLKTEEA